MSGQPPKFKPFFRDITNLVFTGILLAGLLVVLGYSLYVLKIENRNYSQIRYERMLTVPDLDLHEFDDASFVKLSNFCIDEQMMTWQITKDGRVEDEYFYYFLNNHCDSARGPVVIVEMDEEMNKKFSETTDEKVLLEEIFIGKFYKGYRGCEAPYSSLTSIVAMGNASIYTLIAGETPQKIRKEAVNHSYIALGIWVLNFLAFLIAFISHNTKRKKEYLKQLQQYNQQQKTNTET